MKMLSLLVGTWRDASLRAKVTAIAMLFLSAAIVGSFGFVGLSVALMILCIMCVVDALFPKEEQK